MDIGSIFPLYQEDLGKESMYVPDEESSTLLLSLCREALYLIAEKYSKTNKVVLVPAYTCNTVYLPFKELGWDCVYYSIDFDLRINLDSIKEKCSAYNPSVIIVHPFYGMELDENEKNVLKSLKSENNIIVEDLTQCVFSHNTLDFVDYYVGSYRKWLDIPDGAFVKSNNGTIDLRKPTEENSVFVKIQKAAMLLRGSYFINGQQFYKDISRDLTSAVQIYSNERVMPHKISEFSFHKLKNSLKESDLEKRYNNYIYLFSNLIQKKIRFVCKNIDYVTTAPLYFVFYTERRSDLQKLLAENRIYAPVLWPVQDEEVLINRTVREIFNTILAIPVDQRYGIEDMQQIVNIINDFQND